MKRILSLILIAATLLSAVPFFAFADFENTHINTGDMAADIIAVAETQLGYCEGNNINQLNGTVQGSGDYTKYGKWYGLCPAAWCAMFVSWCANEAGIPTTVIPKHASCDEGMKWFKNNGRWKYSPYYDGDENNDYTPKAGDIIYFGFKSGNEYDATHVGIVYEVDTSLMKVRVLEGNSSAKVQQVSYPLGSAYILGYGTPDYTSDPTPVSYEKGSYIVTVSSLNVRSGPSADCDRLGYVTKGTTVEITEVANDHWGLFDYNGKAGWISILGDYCARLYTIRYNSNGGFGSPLPETKQQNLPFKLSTETPTRQGCTFKGWATSENATEAQYAPGSVYYANCDTTFWAVWEIELNPVTVNKTGSGSVTTEKTTNGYKTTLEADDGCVIASVTVDGVFQSIISDTTILVYEFEGQNEHTIDVTFSEDAVEWDAVYTDVKTTAWYYNGCRYCYVNRIMTGTAADKFSPNLNLTRGSFALILANVYKSVNGDIEECEDNPFEDVNISSYYGKYVCWAYKKGYVSGTGNDKFSPDKALTREQIALILYNAAEDLYLDKSNVDLTVLEGYTDKNSASEWAKTALCWAVTNGLLSGNQNKIMPTSPCTRAQIALIVYNFLKINPKK